MIDFFGASWVEPPTENLLVPLQRCVHIVDNIRTTKITHQRQPRLHTTVASIIKCLAPKIGSSSKDLITFLSSVTNFHFSEGYYCARF